MINLIIIWGGAIKNVLSLNRKCHDIGITLTAEASPEVDQDVLLFRTALVSVATLYRMKADATICISRSLLKFIYWLQCNTIAVKMYLVLQ